MSSNSQVVVVPTLIAEVIAYFDYLSKAADQRWIKQRENTGGSDE